MATTDKGQLHDPLPF